jgi:hypothetical protein
MQDAAPLRNIGPLARSPQLGACAGSSGWRAQHARPGAVESVTLGVRRLFDLSWRLTAATHRLGAGRSGRPRRSVGRLSRTARHRRELASTRRGLLIFLAMLPQFTDAHGAWPVRVQLAGLSLVFVATCGGFYTIIGLAARAVLCTKPGGPASSHAFPGQQ